MVLKMCHCRHKGIQCEKVHPILSPRAERSVPKWGIPEEVTLFMEMDGLACMMHMAQDQDYSMKREITL